MMLAGQEPVDVRAARVVLKRGTEAPTRRVLRAAGPRTTEPGLVARLTGELHGLLTLPLKEDRLVLALAELGMEVAPPAPYTSGAWMSEPAARLRA
ncbi:hypothetical protein R6L23_05590 [Streptomyces sp. SR27]|uniref:contact-dependent growth inhibition system immunity protein n=1 Tax=Streptomyces sp. SR27 TaxID=3076630 RepID=UPI00295BD0AA|nr:contact-dependent growth inhibition system immunity protein [Streptomyces sp. SR27]MDV9187692.1 hypothetical protein [Streptomyces sp. SR27]